MKRKPINIIALVMSLMLVMGTLSGCFSSNVEPSPNPAPTTAPTQEATNQQTATPAPSEAPAVDPLDTTSPVELNLSVFYNNTVYMKYTVVEGKSRPTSEYVAANGKTYREGDFKPVWEELQSRLNFKINDVTPTDAKDIAASFTSLQAQGFNGVDVMVGGALNIVSEGVQNGTFVNLDKYLDIMPNFNGFLNNNSIVKTTITAGDGHIYYAPYFDGMDDIERMFMLRTDWVQKLLDDDGAQYDTDRKVDTIYTAYMPETLTTEINAVKADGSGTQVIKKSYTKNVITSQNELPVKDGASLVQVLKDHIDATYGGAYAKRSALFIGQDAAYDADEMVALMRCVLANSTMLTGQSEFDAVAFFPRSNQAGRVQDLFRLAQIWGIRGLDSRMGWLYIDENGELQDSRFGADLADGIERINMLYREGLILKDFDKTESTSGLTGADHRERLLKANLGFMTYDYNQTSTVYNSVAKEGNDPYIPGFYFTPVLPPVADWDGNGKYYQFTESWRSVKSDGWAILAAVEKDEAKLMRALKLFDYMYSPEGNRLMSYGPEAWIDGTIVYNGKEVPKLSAAALTELKSLAGNNYTNYYRMWLGATFPIGYVKEQGMEYQTVHDNGKTGLEFILRACELGTMKHLVLNSADAQNPAQLSVPTTFATTTAEEQFLKDNCTELNNNFKNGNNDNDRILYTDFVLYGFGGKTHNGDSLKTKDELVTYLSNELNGDGYLQVYRSAYSRMVK